MRKVRVLSLVLVMTMLLTACGGTKTNETSSTQKNRDAVFEEIQDAYAIEGDISQITVVDEVLYVEQYQYNYDAPQARIVDGVAEAAAAPAMVAEDAVEEVVPEEEFVEEFEETAPTTTRIITGFLADGTVKSRMERAMDNQCGAGSFTADSEGNIYSIMYQYATYEGDDTKDKVYLECYGPDGSDKWKIQLNENMAAEEYFYASTLYCDEMNQIVMESSRGIEVYDAQGNPVKLVEKPNTDDSRLLRIRDGKFAVVSSDGSYAAIQTVDMQSGTYGEKTNLPFNYYRYQIINGLYHDLYLCDDYGVYGYNVGDAELTKIMDFISSDFSGNYLYQVTFVDENTFVAYYYDEEGVQLSKFEKIPAEEVVDKIELTLGCYYLNSDIKRKLIEFNKNSDQYKIYIRDYATYDTMEDYSQGLTRLNADIVAGDVPDIMILNSQMPAESYIAKGVFADLNQFLEKDNDVKKEDLLPNVLQALSYDGSLYRIAPSFSVNTFAAKTADVGEEPGWTMDEAMAILAGKPEGTQLLSEITASNFMYYTMWICGQEYVNWESGECYFDAEGFRKILEYANSLPREIDYTGVMDDESYWQEMETQYRNEKTILSMQYISSFRDYAYAKQAVFGEDITLIGFPTESGVGGSLNIGNTMAISALSKNQDAAWEFLKSFLMEDYQDNLGYDFPIRISSLQKLEEKSWEKPYTIDEEGNKHTYDDYFYLGGIEVEVVPLTKEESGELLEYIESLDIMCTYNEALNNIITEETESYFSGQKSVDEVVDIIQSRAKIYVSENS